MSPDTSQDIVTAVIVAHDGAAWIASVVHAVASQTRPVQRVVAVDTGSRDRSGSMLTQAFGRGAVFGVDRATGYGAAVAQALRHRAANTRMSPVTPGGRGERTEWVWLIHDDCEPAPDALERLLAGSRQVPASAVLGPKVRDWADRRVLLEAGVTIDRACRRLTGIEPREVDQGQHDGDRDVVAVSSAGMLVRRDVWDRVGGFDPAMRLFREDIDFCWRVQAAGFRVRLITGAVVYHAEASTRNRRPVSAAPHRRREERRNGLLTLLANLPARPMLSALAGNLFLSTLRTLFFLLAKRPAAALDEAAAVASVAAHPRWLHAARRHRARGRQSAYGRLRSELPPSRSLRKLAEFAAGALSKSLPVDTVGSHHATEDPSDDDSLLVDSGIVQRLLTNPGVLLFLALTVITLVAARSLLRSGPLGGGALIPAWGGVSGLWHEYLQGFHPVGIGTAASTPPYVAVIAILATVLGGKPWLAVDVILLGCVPLAGVTAFVAAGRVTRFVPARVWAALTYALLPVGMGAVAAGRLGTAVVLVLAPVAALLAGRSLTGPRRRARRAAWAAALVVAVAAAFVPLILLAAAAAMAAGAAAFRYRRGAPLNAAIVALVPPLLLMPWTIDLATRPARLFLEAGLTTPGLASPALPARSLLLLSPGGPGLPPYWVTAGLAFAAVVALVAGGRRALVYAGWALAVIGMIAAASVSRVAVRPLGSATPVPAWPGPALVIAAVGLLLAAVAAADGMPELLRSGRWRAVPGLAVFAVAVLACTAPVLAAAHWVKSGIGGPVAPAAGPLLPEFVSVSAGTGEEVRTLVLRPGPHGSISYTVLRSTDPQIGSGELAMPTAGQRALNLAVATLTAASGGDAQDQGGALASFGIGYVMLPAPVRAGLAGLLDGVPGLRPLSSTPAFKLWRVVGTAARVTVTEPGGHVVALKSGPVDSAGAVAPPAGGTLVLAEPAGGWSATLNGRPLPPLRSPVNGWAQGFHLPPGGGSLSIGRSQLGRTIAVAAEGAAVLIVIGLGLPGAREPGKADEAAETLAPGRRAAGRGKDRAERPRGHRAAGRGRDVPDGAVPGDAIPSGAAPAGAAAVPEPAAPVAAARVRGAPGTGGTPGMRGTPGVRGAPGMLGAPGIRGAPGVRGAPGMQRMSRLRDAASPWRTPGGPDAPAGRDAPGGRDSRGGRDTPGRPGGPRGPRRAGGGYAGPEGPWTVGRDEAGRPGRGNAAPASRHRHRRPDGHRPPDALPPDWGRHEPTGPEDPDR